VGMDITVRRMRDDDARSFLDVHHAAVRGIAAKDYPQSVIEAWAPLPITESSISAFLVNRDGEIRLVAEVDGKISGIGALVTANNELRACYVLPSASRQGVGSAIVREIESIARQHGLTFLQLESSRTAEAFYQNLGYEILERGEHTLRPGMSMAGVKMAKRLEPRLVP
jgi:putative acetyltransferase